MSDRWQQNTKEEEEEEEKKKMLPSVAVHQSYQAIVLSARNQLSEVIKTSKNGKQREIARNN